MLHGYQELYSESTLIWNRQITHFKLLLDIMMHYSDVQLKLYWNRTFNCSTSISFKETFSLSISPSFVEHMFLNIHPYITKDLINGLEAPL